MLVWIPSRKQFPWCDQKLDDNVMDIFFQIISTKASLAKFLGNVATPVHAFEVFQFGGYFWIGDLAFEKFKLALKDLVVNFGIEDIGRFEYTSNEVLDLFVSAKIRLENLVAARDDNI